MAVAAAVKFVQGATIGTPGEALFGVLAVLVVVSNGVNTGVVRWKFEVLDVPPGSAVATGVVQDGALSTYSFTPDVRGGYLVRLTVFSAGDAEQAVDARCFGVKEVSTRFIPPFTPIDVRGDLPLNFLGQLRGWAKYLEEWLHAIDAVTVVGLGARAFQSVAQAIPNAAFTAVTFTSETYDDAAFHDNAVNSSRIAIPVGLGGRYLITASVQFDTIAAGLRVVGIRQNGVAFLAATTQLTLTGEGPIVIVTTVNELAAGDYIEAVAQQDSGAPLNTVPSTFGTFFLAQRVK